MKKPLLLLVFCFVALTARSQYTAIPDSNFEVALATYDDIPGDNQVPTANISTVTELDVRFSNISDLTGIEAFTSLLVLECFGNQLTSLNISANLSLRELYCDSNQLTTLDVSGNDMLRILWCQFNQLTSLTLNGANDLQEVYCIGNQLTALDVTGVPALQLLYCPGNMLTDLQVGSNANLTQLYLHDNFLTNIDLSGLANLTTVWCYSNQLASLDVTNAPNLGQLLCNDNQINGSLLLNGLANLVSFDGSNNPALVCIQVDDATAADAGTGIYAGWVKDGTASYSENCALSSPDFSAQTATLYPNPARETVTLSFPAGAELEYTAVYNLQGQKVMESKATQIDVSSLSPGVYLLAIQTDGSSKIFYKKLIVAPSE